MRRNTTQRGLWLLGFGALAWLLLSCGGGPPKNGQLPPSGGPQFVINSPRDGSQFAGATWFSVQPFNPAEVASVKFEIGGSERVPESAIGEDKFKVFLISRDYPEGELRLTATVTGTNGRVSTQTIKVKNVPSPPSTAVVGPDGAALGTVEANGAMSALIVPAGVGQGAKVSFSARTQEEVKASTGVDYEALGVTFLGAQEIETDRPIDQALMVSSGGFGPMVQPGQAIVNYMIVPDPEGGVGQLVVANTASVAPNGDVISDPVPQIQLGSAEITSSAGTNTLRTLADGLSGRPGTRIEVNGQGFTPGSVFGNIAIFHSTVDGHDYEIPLIVTTSGTQQVASVLIPPMPAGPATLTLHNRSTLSSTPPINVTAQPPAPLSEPPINVIKDFISQSKLLLADPIPGDPHVEAMKQQALATLIEAERQLEQLASTDDPVIQQALVDIAAVIREADLIQPTGAVRPQVSCDSIKWVGRGLSVMGSALMNAGRFNPTAFAVGATFRVAGGMTQIVGPSLCNDSQCSPSPSGANEALAAGGGNGGGGGGTTGMGSAPPPGGGGCGSTAGGGSLGMLGLRSASLFNPEPGRFLVKVFVGGSPVPFSGVTDAGGYFFIPFIPAGQPFTALAIDVETGDTRTFEGVGPDLGDSVFMFFDFFSEAGESPVTPIELNTNTEGTLEAGEVDLYTFSAAAGQLVSAGLIGVGGFTGIVDLTITAPSGTTVSRISSGSVGHFVQTDVLELGESGTYVLTISGRQNAAGAYVFGLAEVAPPANLTFGSTVDALTGEVAVLGARTFYRFDGSAGDLRNFVLAHPAASLLHARLLVRRPHASPFYERPAIANVNTFDTVRTRVTDILRLPEAGEYVLELVTSAAGVTVMDKVTGAWELAIHTATPANIQLEDVVSDSIEAIGEFKLYAFEATPGQVVFFHRQSHGTGAGNMRWKAEDEGGEVVFSTCLGCSNPGVYVLTSGGTYTITVGGADTRTGAFQFRVWNVPPPDEFTIAIGDTVSNGVPGPGAGHIETAGVKDIYHFEAAPGQVVYFDIQGHSSTSGQMAQVGWKAEDANGNVLFNRCLGCGDPGLHTLTLGGTYTITVGSDTVAGTGTYQFQVRDESQ